MKPTVEILFPVLTFFLIATLACAAKEARFLGWDDTVADFLVAGGSKEPVTANNGIFSPAVVFSPSDNGLLEVYRMVERSDGKAERSVLGRCRLPSENRLLVLLVPQTGKDLPYEILAFPDPVDSAPEKSAAFFFNLYQVPLAIQVGEYGKESSKPLWPTPHRTIPPQNAERWSVPSNASRMPVTVVVAPKGKPMRKLFTRNLMLIPRHRAYVFFREESIPGEVPRPGEGVHYTLCHEPLDSVGP